MNGATSCKQAFFAFKLSLVWSQTLLAADIIHLKSVSTQPGTDQIQMLKPHQLQLIGANLVQNIAV